MEEVKTHCVVRRGTILCEIVCAKRYKLNSCLAIYECSHEECFFGLRIRTFDALATRVCDENQESYEEENVLLLII